MTIVRFLWTVISQILTISMALERVSVRLDMLILWMPVCMGIVMVVSWTKIMLRIIVGLMDIWSLVKVSRSKSLNVMARKLVARIIHVRNVVRWIWQVLLLL